MFEKKNEDGVVNYVNMALQINRRDKILRWF